MALDHAMNVGNLIADNPAKRVKKPRSTEPKPRRILEREEIRQLLLAVEDSEWEAFYRLALFTGARRGELLALRWPDIDFEKEILTIRRNIVQVKGKPMETSPKNGQTRQVKLDSGTIALLRRAKSRQSQQRLALGEHWKGNDDFITTKADGSALNPHSATQHWSRLARRLGITHVRLHDARHTHATLLLAAGEQLHVVADRLGHIDAMVTSTVYAHVLRDQVDEAAKVFADAVGLD
ncbi:site-specific integrase [Candidatus Nanopelagicales bacterium]|nr:site-specific integrase [Candidatus Nanopelagicales bacterium]